MPRDPNKPLRKPVSSETGVKAAEVGRTKVAGTPRLWLYKSPKGVVRYFYRYTVPHKKGQPSWVTETHVGRPGISLNRAKEIATLQYAAWLRDGRDPQDVMRWQQVEEATYGQVVDKWIEDNRHDQ